MEFPKDLFLGPILFFHLQAPLRLHLLKIQHLLIPTQTTLRSTFRWSVIIHSFMLKLLFDCLTEVKAWMASNSLNLKKDKTGHYFWSQWKLQHFSCRSRCPGAVCKISLNFGWSLIQNLTLTNSLKLCFYPDSEWVIHTSFTSQLDNFNSRY